MLMNVSSVFGTNWKIQENGMEKARQKSTQALPLAALIYFLYDGGAAARYGKYVKYYPTKKEGKKNVDTAIDLLVFPLVDSAVGRVMAPVKKLAYIRCATQHMSPYAAESLLDNAQLITSAAITQTINLSVEKGPTKIDKDDVQKFGKACLIQMSCEAVDQAVIKPLVQMTVGDDTSLIGWVVHGGLNMAFFSLFTGMVVKN